MLKKIQPGAQKNIERQRVQVKNIMREKDQREEGKDKEGLRRM